MESVPDAFCDAVAGCVYNNTKIKCELLQGAWKAAFAAQMEKREVYGLFLRPKRESESTEFFEYKFLKARANDETQYEEEGGVFIEDVQNKAKYVRINQIKLMLENDKTLTGWKKVPNIEVFEMLIKFAVSLINSQNKKNALYLQIVEQHREYGLAVLRNIKHCEFWSLTMYYLGEESESFLRARLKSLNVSSLHLIGKWPAVFGQEIIDFYAAMMRYGKVDLPHLRVDSACDIKFPQEFHLALATYFIHGRFPYTGVDIGIRYTEEATEAIFGDRVENRTCGFDDFLGILCARNVGGGVVLYGVQHPR
ncbi:hypothetical protein QR680_011352 [Steinernema hermaphroditum]|uniref:Uncharacterized protein n=1 Tax=Steinernema hermaphroditum TaxID=289476 RepID=A0AA39ITS9_9BILA|nr:hypothetical protein QR680_011352 [Steinernema hermaphroditum]